MDFKKKKEEKKEEKEKEEDEKKEEDEEKEEEENEDEEEEEDEEEDDDEYFNKTPSFILAQKHSSKINTKINLNIMNLLKHIEKIINKSKENYINPVDSFLIFAIKYKIFYDLGIAGYIFIYRCKNKINICEKKETHELFIEEEKKIR